MKIGIIGAGVVSGVGVCLNPSESALYDRIGYTPIGFSSIQNYENFNGKISIVCQNWTDILHSLHCSD